MRRAPAGALAAGALAVAALVILLLTRSRPGTAPGAGAGPGAGGAEAAGPRAPVPPAPELSAPAPRPGGAEPVAPAERSRPASRPPDPLATYRLTVRPMRDARSAFHRREYRVALARAQDALAVDPTSSTARVLATLAACGLGDRALAESHAGKLDETRRGQVAARCAALGAPLGR